MPQGKLLGYGTVTFADPNSVARVLQAAKLRHGRLRVPFAAEVREPSAIALTSLEDCTRAYQTTPSIRQAVETVAPLAREATTGRAKDYFYVVVERQEVPPRPITGPVPRPNLALLKQFDGFAGGLAHRAAQYAHEDWKRVKGKSHSRS